MGRPKESLPFLGTTLLGHQAGMLGGCTAPVLVVARGGDQQLPPLPDGILVAPDERPDGGPLWGLATGLRFLRRHGLLGDRDAVFATACDMPFVTPAVVGFLAGALGAHDLVLPEIDGALQPLAAVYRLAVADVVAARLAAGDRSLRALARHVPTRIVTAAELAAVDPGLRSVVSLDTEAAYAELLRRHPG